MSRAAKHRLSVAGLVVSGLIVVILLTSTTWTFGCMSGEFILVFGPGFFGVGFPDVQMSYPLHWFLEWHAPGQRLIWLPEYFNGLVGIPLWMVFLVVFIPSLIGWRRYRRPPPGHCQKCGYDLTGNVSGVCPECGKPTNHDLGERP